VRLAGWPFRRDSKMHPEFHIPTIDENDTLFFGCEWICGSVVDGIENVALIEFR